MGVGWQSLGGSFYAGLVVVALASLDANTKGLPGSWTLSPGAQNKVPIHEDPSFLISTRTHCGAGEAREKDMISWREMRFLTAM